MSLKMLQHESVCWFFSNAMKSPKINSKIRVVSDFYVIGVVSDFYIEVVSDFYVIGVVSDFNVIDVVSDFYAIGVVSDFYVVGVLSNFDPHRLFHADAMYSCASCTGSLEVFFEFSTGSFNQQ